MLWTKIRTSERIASGDGSLGYCTSVLCDEVRDLIQVNLGQIMLVQESLCCGVWVLGYIEWQLQCWDTLTDIDIKDVVVFDAIEELLSVLSNSIDNLANLGP